MKLAFIGDNDLPSVEWDSRFAVANGFEGLEYNYWGNFKDLTLETVQQMRAIHDKYGAHACALGIWGWNHLAPDPAERAEAHAMIDRAIEYAQVLGADHLILGGGEIPEAPLEQKVEEFLKVFPPILERIEKLGIVPVFYAVHGNSFFTTIEAYEAVWEHLPNVYIKFDPANWCHRGHDYLKIMRDHSDKIGYMHIKEHVYMDDELVSQPAAGMGDIEWGKVMAFLYEADFRGYLSCEPHGPKWSRAPLREKMLLLSKKYLSPFLLG
jgi:sugar phosphate isomerase/epimerase